MVGDRGGSGKRKVSPSGFSFNIMKTKVIIFSLLLSVMGGWARE